ncbi:MAG: hypothetical protein P0S96_03400 [Simkaniaceae bacterium]|nr:hypothetical protein [Candidatus Sacchlamyda saccharinae]
MNGLDFSDPAVTRNLAFKPAMRALDWAGKSTEEALQARAVCCRSNSILRVLDVPNKVNKLGRSVVSLAHCGSCGDFFDRVINVFKKFTSLIGVVVSGIQIAHEEGLLSLEDYQFSILDGIGFAGSLALFLKSGAAIRKNFTLLSSSRVGSYEFNLSLLKLVGRICGLVTGVFGLATFALNGGLQARYVMLGISTISLTISIAKYYLTSLYSENRAVNNIIML